MASTTQRIVLLRTFDGEPKLQDFKLVQEKLPALRDGEYLCEALYLSVDPYMRAFDLTDTVGKQMIGIQVAKVVESRCSAVKVGDLVLGHFGWQTRNVVHHKDGFSYGEPYVLPDFEGLSPSLGLGALGMPGNTAYFGFLEVCQPKAGETVVVNAAAGAVGMHVGQIAKIKGCRVIGFAGADDKVKWLKNEIGFDEAFNYKTVDIDAALSKAAPNGVDCYFDNVGGEMSSRILTHMNSFGRVSVCGAISSYSYEDRPKASLIQIDMNRKQLRMEGFMVSRWEAQWFEGIRQNLRWIKEGKLKYHETVTEGFANMPQALVSLLRGENFGKAVVKA
ncbi:hypothetical protein B566_EDAN004011 [Ephemera danica]|nr:hypothetical protein B566_EDAN004011 [Ephemera danica]